MVKNPAGCRNSLISELETELDVARNNKEWERDYMTLEMLKRDSREEGRDEERKRMVIALLKNGVPVTTVTKASNMTVEEIKAIKQENNL